MYSNVKTVELSQVVGRIYANMLLPYLPWWGYPVVMPGEMITEGSRAVLDLLLILYSIGQHYPGVETNNIHCTELTEDVLYWVRY
ncbi:hypothetical protein [Sodalis-like endosymbiont of Proechinophthirus fluctus]|uniref:Orn/Lys/Arg family decarboxylase n=1 Tax=Sodalis-like endosymbiont of Proechinophthirus fluctus TaxID=1462730 RepID=UPI001FCAD859|nr:hypothetical protein [Sodalis-like endosymbiont of Proechinophthirus fluctus]